MNERFTNKDIQDAGKKYPRMGESKINKLLADWIKYNKIKRVEKGEFLKI